MLEEERETKVKRKVLGRKRCISSSQTVRLEVVLNDRVTGGGIVVECQTVARVGLDVRLEGTSVGEAHLDAGRDGGEGRPGVEAITTAVWQIVGCDLVLVNASFVMNQKKKLTSGDDKNRALESVGHGQTRKSQELSSRDGLLSLLSVVENAGVEVRGVEEQVLLRVDVGVGQVAGRVVVRRQCSKVDGGNVVGQAKGPDGRADHSTVDGTSKTEGLVEVSVLEVGAGSEKANEGSVEREAGKNDAVGDVGVHCCECVCLSGAERVADVNDLRKGVVDHGERAVTQLLGHGCERGNFEAGLNCVSGFKGVLCVS